MELSAIKRNLMERDFDEEFLSIFLDYNGQNNSLVEYLLLNYSIDEINKIINQKWVSVYISSVFILFEITFKSYNNIVLISLEYISKGILHANVIILLDVENVKW